MLPTSHPPRTRWRPAFPTAQVSGRAECSASKARNQPRAQHPCHGSLRRRGLARASAEARPSAALRWVALPAFTLREQGARVLAWKCAQSLFCPRPQVVAACLQPCQPPGPRMCARLAYDVRPQARGRCARSRLPASCVSASALDLESHHQTRSRSVVPLAACGALATGGCVWNSRAERFAASVRGYSGVGPCRLGEQGAAFRAPCIPRRPLVDGCVVYPLASGQRARSQTQFSLLRVCWRGCPSARACRVERAFACACGSGAAGTGVSAKAFSRFVRAVRPLTVSPCRWKVGESRPDQVASALVRPGRGLGA